MKIATGGRVVVCDGGRFVVYENHGDTDRIDLRVAESATLPNPPTRQQGDDRPGRYPATGGQRSAVGQTDWHEEAEKRFLSELAAKIDQWASASLANKYVLIAPPRAIGHLRAQLSHHAEDQMLASVTGDYAHQPTDKIETLIGSI